MNKINNELDRIGKALQQAGAQIEEILLAQQVSALKRAMKAANVTGIVRITEAGNIGLWFAVAMLAMAVITIALTGGIGGALVNKIVGTLASL